MRRQISSPPLSASFLLWCVLLFFLFLKDTLQKYCLCPQNSETPCEIVQRPFSSLLHNGKGSNHYYINSRKYSIKQSHKLFTGKGRGYWSNGQCVAEFCLLDSARKTVVMLVNWINEFSWLAEGSGNARIKKEVEISITVALMQLKQLPSHSPNNLWILALIK